MKRKTGFVEASKKTAAALAVAVLIYRLLRVISNDTLTRYTNPITDKIANLFMSNKTSTRIYDAAIQRLKTKFTAKQAAILATLMVQQSKYETANYTSNVFRNNMNAFGYKDTNVSIYDIDSAGTMSPEGNRYELYADVADSAREVADWIGRRKKDFITVTNEQQYAEALKKSDYYGQSAIAYAAGLKVYNQTA